MVKRNPQIIRRNRPPGKFIQLKQSDSTMMREMLYHDQAKKCPVIGKRFPLSEMAMDHKHKLKAQTPGPDGRGLVRGLIHGNVNTFEGIAYKKYLRQGLQNMMPFPDLLIALGEYLKNPPCRQCYIHHTEKPKAPTFGKRDYDRICKYYFEIFPRARKLPAFPKSGIKKKFKKVDGKRKAYYVYRAKLSNKWRKLLEAANAIHERKKK